MSNFFADADAQPPGGNYHLEVEQSSDMGMDDSAKMSRTVIETERWFTRYRADTVVRNMSYYRGEFWFGDGIQLKDTRHTGYRAERNETFPIIDTIVSALAMDLPQCEALDRRQMSYARVSRGEDSTFSGKRQASVLNWFAEEDAMDVTVREMALLAEVFDEGGIVKTTWSPKLGRVIWRTKLPWEVHFDPNAKRYQDSSYAFERFTLHYDEYKALLKSTYDKPKTPIRADTFPRSIVEEKMHWEDDEALRVQGMKQYISLVEFWDFRNRKLYHIHPATSQILMAIPIPYGRPYDVLIPHPGIGRIRGLSDVSLMAPVQRDINELVSARREIVNRLPRRMLVDRGMFQNTLDWERFKNSRSWEPTLVSTPPDRTLGDGIYVTPEMPTTFDFNKHLDQDIEHVRWIPGMSDYQRGGKQNFRTAEEAGMVKNAAEGRLNIRMTQLTRIVENMFNRAREATRWALRNQEASQIDMRHIHAMTQSDADLWTLTHDLATASPKFRILPFSPLMEDRNTRRRHHVELLDRFASTPMVEHVNWEEMTRETMDLHGLRPSLLTVPAQGEAALQDGAPPQPQAVQQGGPPPPPPGLSNVLGFPQG